MEDYNPETVTIGPEIATIKELSEHTLDNISLSASEGVLEVIEGLAWSDLASSSRIWLDNNFFRFPWTNEKEAFKRYALVIVDCEYPYMNRILQSIPSQSATTDH